LAANTSIQQDFARAQGIEPTVLMETGIRSLTATENRAPRDPSRPFKMLWSGLLIPRKALNLLIEAIAELPPDLDYELHVMGDGPMRKAWQQLAVRLGVDRHIRWMGWVSHQEALEQYAACDTFVFTSLRDTTGTVILEALAAGLPVIGLDHQGVRDVITPDCGLKVPVTSPRQVVSGLARSLVKLARDPVEQARLSRGAVERAKRFLWTQLGENMARVYCQVIDSSGSPAPAKRFDFSKRTDTVSSPLMPASSATPATDESLAVKIP
jgi:glycosyltransferase involved in cell wall biosynthesis